MRILFTRFPLESRLGGAELQTISLMEGLLARGHAVAFAGSCPTLLKLCKEHNIPAAEWHIGPPPVSLWHALTFFWRARSMKSSLTRLLKQFSDVDAVCMLSLSEKLLLTSIAAEQKKKVLWIEHDRIGRWLRRNPYLRQLRRQSKVATIVTVSNLSKRLMREMKFDNSRIHAIPNGIDAKRFSRLPARKQDNHFTIGCVARLTQDKGVHVLVEAVKNTPDMFLTIIGDGPEKKNLPTAKNIRIWPTIDNVGAFYREINLLVLPSIDNDPFGMVAAEAMLCGTPVIVTDQCGIAGYLEHKKDAWIVKANDPVALRHAIEHIRSDASLWKTLSLEGKKTAEKDFSMNGMIERYADLLKV